jgi:hypothetical protein
MRHPCPRCGRSCQGGPRSCCWYCRLLASRCNGLGCGGGNKPRKQQERDAALPEWKLRILRRRVRLGLPLFNGR